MKLNRILSALFFVIIGLIANGCASAPADEAAAEVIMLEVEDAVLEGNLVKNQGPDNADKDGSIAEASGDMFYMQDTGQIDFTFDVPTGGDYLVKVYYALPDSYGEKKQFVHVNGEDIGELPFPPTGGDWVAKWIQVELKDGENTLSIVKSWGYTWFDYITVEPLI